LYSTALAIITSPLSHLERAMSPPLRQRMDSPTACASCAMPTADEFNHTLYPHHTDGHTYPFPKQ